MSDPVRQPVVAEAKPAAGRLLVISALLVVLLALGAVLWPRGGGEVRHSRLLVFDTGAHPERRELVYQPLADWLSALTGRRLDLEIVGDRSGFLAAGAGGADFVFCPDGLALALDRQSYRPVVAVRRPAPMNLRPRSVLLRRKSAPASAEPWREQPTRTVFGDSLSLTGCGALETADRTGNGERPSVRQTVRQSCAWGPDPYDHAPVLHAARLGCFDYVVVRQWDASRFFQTGLLSLADWDQSNLTMPVPDIVLMTASDLPTTERLAVREAWSALGRSDEPEIEPARRVQLGLAGLQLAGFNILLEPDLDLARRSFNGDWLTVGD